MLIACYIRYITQTLIGESLFLCAVEEVAAVCRSMYRRISFESAEILFYAGLLGTELP